MSGFATLKQSQLQTKALSEQITPLVQRQEEQEEEEEIQTKPLAEQITPLVQRQVEEEEEEPLMTKSIASGTQQVSDDLHSRLNRRRGDGQSLPEVNRSFMERRVGVDCSGVRVHTDSDAVQMSKELHAEAFTHGRDMYFGSGK